MESPDGECVSWAKIDDRANEHRKQLAAGPEACWLWACGLMYVNRQSERDGFIPEHVLTMLFNFKNPKKLADRLVGVSLWDKVADGYLVHNFTVWNQSKEQREAELIAGRERAAKSYASRTTSSVNSSPEENLKKLNSSGSGMEVDLYSSDLDPATSGKKTKLKPWKRFPADYVPDESHKKIAKNLGIDLSHQLELILDYEFKAPKTDPAATLRTWLRNADRFGTAKKTNGQNSEFIEIK